MIGLHQLAPAKRQARKRVGRGHGSGLGTYAGRGIKGQRARTGGRKHLVRRSLKSLIERLPKVRGGSTLRPVKATPVSLTDLERLFSAGARVTAVELKQKRLIPRQQTSTVILGGTLTKALTVEAHRFSAAALAAIRTAGGRAILLPEPVVRRPRRRVASPKHP